MVLEGFEDRRQTQSGHRQPRDGHFKCDVTRVIVNNLPCRLIQIGIPPTTTQCEKMDNVNNYPDVCELYLKNEEIHPDAVAVYEGERLFTYREMISISKQVACLVSQNGEGTKVLIHLRQGALAYAAMFGTLMGGGVYAPINIQAPAERNALIINSFLPDIILTEGKSSLDASKLPRNSRVIDINRQLPQADGRKINIEAALAYVIFTSGSTGIPKGVVISRQALNHYIQWSTKNLALKPGDRCSQHPNIAFDLSVIDIFTTLASGATLYPILKPLHRLMPSRAIADYQLTTWVSVPSVVNLMMKASELGALPLTSLRQMFFCGEALLGQHLDYLFSVNKDLFIINSYGPTEATVSCTQQFLDYKNYKHYCKGTVALGSAIPGMSLSLAGSEGEGELLIAGPQLAEGYWNAPKQTAAKFKTDSRGTRQYHTGDWAVRTDGNIYFSHRVDRQTKIDGYRIELGEIDVNIHEATDLISRTVVANHEIHTFIETDSKLDSASIFSFLKKKLPTYSIPKQIHFLKMLPHNVNDKIDDQALIQIVNDNNS